MFSLTRPLSGDKGLPATGWTPMELTLGAWMKKLLIILGLLCLLVDLADDGFIGKAKVVAPKSSSVSVQQQVDDKLSDAFPGKAAAVVLLATCLIEAHGWFQRQPAAEEVPHPNKIVYCCHFFSSGGLPS